MNQFNVLIALNVFTHYLMEDASENEMRLTLFLLTLISGSTESERQILRSEILSGFESFDKSGKRIYQTLGAGIHNDELEIAIREVNDRRLLQIKVISSEVLLVKLNLTYIQNASKIYINQKGN